MKPTAQIKLLPNPEQAQAFGKTMLMANATCNYLSQVPWEEKVFAHYALPQLTYYPCRERFDLLDQVVCRDCLAKFAGAYKLNQEKNCIFKPKGAIAGHN